LTSQTYLVDVHWPSEYRRYSLSQRHMLLVGFSRRLVVAEVRCVVSHSTAQPPSTAVGHGRQPASDRRVPRRRVSSPDGRDAPALPSRAADATQSTADVLVDEAERRGHDRPKIGDGEQSQRNSEYRV